MSSSSALEGRVFERLRRFQTFSAEDQEVVKQLKAELIITNAFQPEKLSWWLTVTGIKADKLVEFVQTYLQKRKENDDATVGVKERAHHLVDGLVLSGRLALYKESDVSSATTLEKFAENSSTFFVSTDIRLTERATDVSVWTVRDGTIQAGMVKKSMKGYISGPSTKDVYALVNDKLKTFFLFDSDYALKATQAFELSEAHVQFDKSVDFGIKVSTDSGFAIFGVASKEKQDEWLNAIINGGATYREVFNLDMESVKSFYELKDYDMSGDEVSMEKYKGKVILVVNVSSLCKLTPLTYPKLAKLDEKYRDQGLQILAFPCNQFNGQEPGTHEEIMEFVKKYNCTFPFFEKHDVNGADARPVFTYLKAKLPGSFGNFVKWNFTKFLIDRNGQPYKRYAPKDLPFSFEEDIKFLLGQKPAEAP